MSEKDLLALYKYVFKNTSLLEFIFIIMSDISFFSGASYCEKMAKVSVLIVQKVHGKEL